MWLSETMYVLFGLSRLGACFLSLCGMTYEPRTINIVLLTLSQNGCTAYDIAVEKGHDDISKMIIGNLVYSYDRFRWSSMRIAGVCL